MTCGDSIGECGRKILRCFEESLGEMNVVYGRKEADAGAG